MNTEIWSLLADDSYFEFVIDWYGDRWESKKKKKNWLGPQETILVKIYFI